jgi:AmiR/NasT family two-component response regulator
MPRHIQQLISAGAAAYLTKPINVQEMLQVIDDAQHVTVTTRQGNE